MTPEAFDAFIAQLRPAWHEHAACRGQGADRYVVTTARASITAKQVCATCPVAADCLDYALADPTLRGVWGGTSSRDRSRLRRSLKAPVKPSRPHRRLTGPLPVRRRADFSLPVTRPVAEDSARTPSRSGGAVNPLTYEPQERRSA
jgi:WhiB family redox-sensing transcriptional regulator